MSSAEDQINILRDEESTIVVDSTNFPIIYVGWHGAPTQTNVHAYFQLRKKIFDQALAQDKSMIIIVDLSNLKPPPATVRKQLADGAKNDGQIEGFLGHVVAVSNPLLRGVITAISWLMGDKAAPIQYKPNIAEGLKKAMSDLEAAGTMPPQIDTEAYVPPEP